MDFINHNNCGKSEFSEFSKIQKIQTQRNAAKFRKSETNSENSEKARQIQKIHGSEYLDKRHGFLDDFRCCKLQIEYIIHQGFASSQKH